MSCLAAMPTGSGRAAEQTYRRIVSLNWAMSETLYAMGVTPVGAAEIVGYDRMVRSPPTPAGIVDVGFQSDPNLELLSGMKPDLMLIQSWQAGLSPVLERFGHVEAFTIYARGEGDPVARAGEAASRIGTLAGRSADADNLVARAEATFAACRSRLSSQDGRPVYLIQALSPTNLVVFAASSLFGSVLNRIGVTNAWTRPPNLLWGSTQIGVDALMSDTGTHIVWIGSPDGVSSQGLFQSALWQSLPQVKAGRVYELPLIWGFGGLPTAERFSLLVTEALAAGASR